MQEACQLSQSAEREPDVGKTFPPRRRASRQEDREDRESGFIHPGDVSCALAVCQALSQMLPMEA